MDSPTTSERQGPGAAGCRSERLGGDPAPNESDATSPFPLLFGDLAALRAFAGHYLAARVDALTARLRTTLVWVAVGLVGALAAVALLIAAVVLLLQGFADGLTALFGGRAWAGQLTAAAVVLALFGGGAFFGLRAWTAASYRKTREKYERRRQEQRDALGRDADEVARSSR